MSDYNRNWNNLYVPEMEMAVSVKVMAVIVNHFISEMLPRITDQLLLKVKSPHF